MKIIVMWSKIGEPNKSMKIKILKFNDHGDADVKKLMTMEEIGKR